MSKDLNQPEHLAALREQAELILKSRHTKRSRSPHPPNPLNPFDVKRQLHEMEVNRIELEMQSQALLELQQARMEVEEGLARYADLYHFAPVSYFTLDRNGNLCAANLAGATLLGRVRADLVGAKLSSFVAEAFQPEFHEFLAKVFRDPGKQACELALAKIQGNTKFIRIEANADESGQTCRVVVQDITTRREQEEELRLAAIVIDAVDEGVMVTGPDNRIIKVNPAFTTITGYKPEEVIGKSPNMLAAEGNAQIIYMNLWNSLAATDAWQGEIENRRKNGELYVEWLSVKAVRDAQKKILHYLAVFTDISERKIAEGRIRYRAHHDALTDLVNRTLFVDRLEQAIIRAKRDGVHVGLIFVDLDNFKPVNDTFGHQVGDALLKEVGRRLRTSVRASDTVGRFGGDEFVILLPVIDKAQDAMSIADNIQCALREKMDVAGHAINAPASMGIAIYPEHGSDPEALLNSADQAMYRAKRRGGAQSVSFENLDAQADNAAVAADRAKTQVGTDFRGA